MYVKIDGTNYRKIKNLNYAPEVDITGSELPINKFTVEVKIEDGDSFGIGDLVQLFDDQDNLWAKYRITDIEPRNGNVIYIEASSTLRNLDRKIMPAYMYLADPIADVLDSLFGNTAYNLDADLSSATISGYCPEQTARERLQWILFVIRGYARTFFEDAIEIKPIPSEPLVIDDNQVFWKPKVSTGDYVTRVRILSYEYDRGTPSNTDDYVKIGNTTWVYTTQEVIITNNNVPSGTPENTVEIKNVSIINPNNINDLISAVASYYFRNINVDADIIDNAEYQPGDKVVIPVDEDGLVQGFIRSAAFKFGLQARASIQITSANNVNGGILTIYRKYSSNVLTSDKHVLPIGYGYSIENIYLDITNNGERRIYGPYNQYCSGTMTQKRMTKNERYYIALKEANNILSMYSVDNFTEGTDSITIS